jgi:hypothetical protein
MPPPEKFEEFPEKVSLVTVTIPDELKMPPPALNVAEFPDNVLMPTVMVPDPL